MRFQNKTESVQQINKIAGDSQTVLPGNIVEVDRMDVYEFELNRIRILFVELPEEKELPREFSGNKKPTVKAETPEIKNEVSQ